ncbi:MAG: AEC family transporter [Betaproteobacteria bacterium]|nr:AEC family transporter [Betaproteobacteria bacterium]
MQAILAVTVPFFALILAGYWAAQRAWLPLAAIPGLNTFVLFFALPCMLLRFGMNTPLAQLLDPVVSSLYLAVAVLVVAGVLGLGHLLGAPRRDAAFAALVAAFPNSGFIGVPLLVALLGPAAAGPVICTMLLDMMLTTSACLALAQGGHAARGGAGSAFLASLKAPLMNPLPWSIALGGALSALNLGLWGPLDKAVGMLADAASPVALFTIGAVLFRSRVSSAGGPSAEPSSAPLLLSVVGIKLLMHPLLVWSGCQAARALGAPLTDLSITAITLMAALPSASNVSMLAERYGANNGLVARIIMGSTTLAFITFTLWAWGFGVQPLR